MVLPADSTSSRLVDGIVAGQLRATEGLLSIFDQQTPTSMKNQSYTPSWADKVFFVWQFFFAMLNLHGSASEHTPLQDPILERLAELELEEGMYTWELAKKTTKTP